MTNEEIRPAIEILPPLKTKHWETQGGEITVYRLYLLTPQQITDYDLEKYVNRNSTAPLGGEEDDQ